MRRQIAIHQLVYNHLYPNPSSSDPPNFTAHLARNLVPEVRIEVATFYGDLNSVEARYPGLNYCYGPHRLRLGRFKHHRRLFNAFDTLGLTEQEIQDLCCWEGSKWARQKYEEDQGEKVIDTTGDEIGDWVPFQDMTYEEKMKSSTSRKYVSSQQLDRTPSARDNWTAARALANHSTLTTSLPSLPALTAAASMTAAQASALSNAAAATSRDVTERSRALLRRLEEQIMQAWQSGRPLSPELEALVKDRVERGHLPSDFLIQRQRALLQNPLQHDVIQPEVISTMSRQDTTQA